MTAGPSEPMPPLTQDHGSEGSSSATARVEPRAKIGGPDDIYTGVLSHLLAGPLTFGGIGYGLDRWLGWSWCVPVGIVMGMALALYVIWLRYGK